MEHQGSFLAVQAILASIHPSFVHDQTDCQIVTGWEGIYFAFGYYPTLAFRGTYEDTIHQEILDRIIRYFLIHITENMNLWLANAHVFKPPLLSQTGRFERLKAGCGKWRRVQSPWPLSLEEWDLDILYL